MFFRKKPIFIGFHFAKTGGTSIKSHVTSGLGRNECYSFGNFAHANNFFAGKPLLPEMRPWSKARIRFVYGHGVGTEVLHHFAKRDIALFVVCRDPYRRFLSSFKHSVRTQRKFGSKVQLREVFESQTANPFSRNLLSHFGALATSPTRDPKQRLIEILKCFRFVMSTDNLYDHSRPFFSALGLAPMTEAKRVYPESVDLGDLTEEEIRARDDLDAFVNETVNAHYADRPGTAGAGSVNAFGFDETALRDRIAALAAAAPSNRDDIQQTYFDLFRFLDTYGRLEAAKTLVDSGQQSARIAEIFARYCRETGRGFDDGDLPSRNLCFQTEVYLRLNERDKAAECARRAVEADPNNPMAFFLAGRAAMDQRRYADGATNLERAVQLNPTHAPSFRNLAAAYTRLGRTEEAARATKSAERI